MTKDELKKEIMESFDERFGSDCGRIHVAAGTRAIKMEDIKSFLSQAIDWAFEAGREQEYKEWIDNMTPDELREWLDKKAETLKSLTE